MTFDNKLLNFIVVHFVSTLKDEENSNFEFTDYFNDVYSVKPMTDLCNDYVNFLIKEEKNKILMQNEVKEVKKKLSY